jgi:hypothetical protein
LDKQEFEEWGTLILFNKNTACLKGIMFRRDDTHIEEEIFKKCERINYYVKNKIIPHAEYNEVICSECPFNHICDVAQLNSSDAFLIDELELIEAIKERERLKESYKKYDELDEFIKESLKNYKKETGKSYFVLGDYEVKVNTINSKKYEIPDEIKNKYVTVNSYEKIMIRPTGGSIPSLINCAKADVPNDEELNNCSLLSKTPSNNEENKTKLRTKVATCHRPTGGSIPSLINYAKADIPNGEGLNNSSQLSKPPSSNEEDKTKLRTKVATCRRPTGGSIPSLINCTKADIPNGEELKSPEQEPTDAELASIQNELDEKEKLMKKILHYYKKSGTNININEIKNELILKNNDELRSLL